jgi:hypothetical protein
VSALPVATVLTHQRVCVCAGAQMRAWSRARRAAGETVALVPTMGFLHDGHLSLVRAAAAEASRVVVGASLCVCPASASRGGLTGLAGVTTRPAGYPSGGAPPAVERQLHLHHTPSRVPQRWGTTSCREAAPLTPDAQPGTPAVGYHQLSRGSSTYTTHPAGYPSGGVPPAVERQLHLLTYSLSHPSSRGGGPAHRHHAHTCYETPVRWARGPVLSASPSPSTTTRPSPPLASATRVRRHSL